MMNPVRSAPLKDSLMDHIHPGWAKVARGVPQWSSWALARSASQQSFQRRAFNSVACASVVVSPQMISFNYNKLMIIIKPPIWRCATMDKPKYMAFLWLIELSHPETALMRATLHHLNKLASRSQHAEGAIGSSYGCLWMPHVSQSSRVQRWASP